MKIVLIILGIIVLLIIVYMTYRYFAFMKESAKIQALRSERVQVLIEKLKNGEVLTQEEVLPYAKDNKTREMTYQVLAEQNKTDLFPKEYLTIESGAESNLVNWLEFPTELDKAPDDIQHLEKVSIPMDGNEVFYHVFKYMTLEPHWAAKDGWMLGVVGPFFTDSKPYDFPGATFSRCSSKLGEVKPEEEARWVHENIALRRK